MIMRKKTIDLNNATVHYNRNGKSATQRVCYQITGFVADQPEIYRMGFLQAKPMMVNTTNDSAAVWLRNYGVTKPLNTSAYYYLKAGLKYTPQEIEHQIENILYSATTNFPFIDREVVATLLLKGQEIELKKTDISKHSYVWLESDALFK
jgi:hypothetical protein